MFYVLLQKVVELVLRTATGTEVSVATMTNVLYGFNDSLVEALNQMKNLKLKDRLWENVADCCDTILVDVEPFESDGAFKP